MVIFVDFLRRILLDDVKQSDRCIQGLCQGLAAAGIAASASFEPSRGTRMCLSMLGSEEDLVQQEEIKSNDEQQRQDWLRCW